MNGAPPLAGLHHVTFGVRELDDACRWFEAVFDATRRGELDHHDERGRLSAVILRIPGVPVPVQLQQSDDESWQRVQAVSLSAPDGSALREWAARLDELGIEHGEICARMSGEAFDLVSPWGLRIRIYAPPT